MAKETNYNTKDFYQKRAVVGERHFVPVDQNNLDCWAIPGRIVVGQTNKGPIFKSRTVTSKQLRAWAKKQGLTMKIVDYPLIRADLK